MCREPLFPLGNRWRQVVASASGLNPPTLAASDIPLTTGRAQGKTYTGQGTGQDYHGQDKGHEVQRTRKGCTTDRAQDKMYNGQD